MRLVVWYIFPDVSEVLVALMMEAEGTSEKSIILYQVNNPENHLIYTYRLENLMFHTFNRRWMMGGAGSVVK